MHQEMNLPEALTHGATVVYADDWWRGCNSARAANVRLAVQCDNGSLSSVFLAQSHLRTIGM